MNLQNLSSFSEQLYSCRFCPMCKPVADVANVTQIESHSTRGKAVLLWRVATGKATFTPRSVELLYQSTLDTNSESWCINHFPVSDYILSARAKVVQKGMLPDCVEEALEREKAPEVCPKSKTVLLAAEAEEIGGTERVQKVNKHLSSLGIESTVYQAMVGTLAFYMGDTVLAKSQGEKLLARLKDAGVKEIITDGPQTTFALRVMFPQLGIELPKDMKVRSLTEVLHEKSGGKKSAKKAPFKKVFVHDSKATFFLGDTMADDKALQPHMNSDEESLGAGAVYDLPRALVDALKMERVFGVWSRSLAKSCGVDDGLWITYPELAEQLGVQRITYALSLGAEAIVSDSLISVEYLNMIAGKMGADIQIVWLPELY